MEIGYAIVIPEEEPKQVWKQIIETCGGKEAFMESAGLKPKQETIKEAAERISPIQQIINFITEEYQNPNKPSNLNMSLLKRWCELTLLNEESKWQAERSCSEEEVYQLTLESLDLGMRIRQDQLNGYSEKSGKELHKEWFEQFKKK